MQRMTKWAVFRLEAPVVDRLRQLQQTWPNQPNQPLQKPPTLTALVEFALDEMRAAPELRKTVVRLNAEIATLTKRLAQEQDCE